MWSIASRMGLSIVSRVNPIKSFAVATSTSIIPAVRNFSVLSKLPALTSAPVGIASESKQLLQSTSSPLVQLVNGFKIKGRLKRRCKDCYFVTRQERMYVMCKSHGRHKQMAMKKSEKNSWILTDATQSKVRPW